MSRRSLVRTLTAASIVALAACSDSSGPEPVISDAELSADVAASVGTAAAADVGLLRGDMMMAGLGGATTAGSAASLVTIDGARTRMVGDHCDYMMAPKLWSCSAETENGLQVERTIQFFANGEAGPTYDAAETDSIKVHASVTGTVVRMHGTITLDNVRDATISGLTGTETSRTVVGTGLRQEASVFTGERGTRTYNGTVANQILSVVFPVGGGFPLSGSMVHDVDATVTLSGGTSGVRSVSRHVVVTFNGTATVPMTIGTLSCTLNLETRAVSCGS